MNLYEEILYDDFMFSGNTVETCELEMKDELLYIKFDRACSYAKALC